MALLTLMVFECPVAKVDITEIYCHAYHSLSLSLCPPRLAPRTPIHASRASFPPSRLSSWHTGLQFLASPDDLEGAGLLLS